MPVQGRLYNRLRHKVNRRILNKPVVPPGCHAYLLAGVKKGHHRVFLIGQISLLVGSNVARPVYVGGNAPINGLPD